MLQFIDFGWMGAVLCGLYVDYSRSEVGHICAMWHTDTFVQGHMSVM